MNVVINLLNELINQQKKNYKLRSKSQKIQNSIAKKLK